MRSRWIWEKRSSNFINDSTLFAVPFTGPHANRIKQHEYFLLRAQVVVPRPWWKTLAKENIFAVSFCYTFETKSVRAAEERQMTNGMSNHLNWNLSQNCESRMAFSDEYSLQRHTQNEKSGETAFGDSVIFIIYIFLVSYDIFAILASDHLYLGMRITKQSMYVVHWIAIATLPIWLNSIHGSVVGAYE